jgi:hypothetical protein
VSCVACGGPLSGRQKKFCSADCSKRAARAAWVEKTYGITLAEWDQILETQGGGCGICERKPRAGETFHLDHEHAQGQAGPVRGILCPYCNTRLIGRLRNHTKAQRMADYLREPPATRALGRVVIAPGRPRKKRASRRRPAS